jgi:branched-chain amino acid transport system permease protein
MDDVIYAIELTVTGMLNGVMYSMIALGFVLIYKASSVFNFAQGAMTLFAALTLTRLRLRPTRCIGVCRRY